MDMNQVREAVERAGVWTGALTIHEVERLEEEGFDVRQVRKRKTREPQDGERRHVMARRAP